MSHWFDFMLTPPVSTWPGLAQLGLWLLLSTVTFVGCLFASLVAFYFLTGLSDLAMSKWVEYKLSRRLGRYESRGEW